VVAGRRQVGVGLVVKGLRQNARCVVMILRTKGHERCPEAWEVTKENYDEPVNAHCGYMAAKHVDAVDFVAKYKVALGLFVDVADLDTIEGYP
jgi:hypothetical protein